LVPPVDHDLERGVSSVGDDGQPGVVLVVGVNGTGKTAAVGRLARVFAAEDRRVVLGAADTFRAAAAEQLQTWGERVDVPVVRGDVGADPASVAFDTVKQARNDGSATLLVDTAARVPTNSGPIDTHGNVNRFIQEPATCSE